MPRSEQGKERRNARRRLPGYRAVERVYAQQPHVKRRILNARLRREYGITLADREAMLSAQGDVCAICGGPPRREGWHVDHDHRTKKVRGVLCGNCNSALGLFKDHPVVIARALAYLYGIRAW